MAAVMVSDNSQSTPAVTLSHDQVFSAIQEILPQCLESNAVEPFSNIFDGKISESMKMCVETAVRYYAMHSIFKGHDTDLTQVTALAKLSIALARQELCLPTLPMLVLSDACDTLTVVQCEKLFSFVEGHVTIFKEPIFFAPCKNQVLRMCNDVLRRLSRSQNTIFCGRILLFLARFFPFSERSGLNLISEFNLENITTFSTTSDADDLMDVAEVKDEDDEIKESKSEKAEKDSKVSLDHCLYTKFWALQDYFRNPIQCYKKQQWQQFVAYTQNVLEAFSSFKLDSRNKAPGVPVITNYSEAVVEAKQDLDKTIIDTLPDVKKVDQYFAKFLTNQRLLELQFSDSNFRRYFLVQLLILCHYLTSSIKFKQENLAPADTEWVKTTEQKVYSLLKETPPDGEQFAVIVKKIIQREDQWNEWKNNGCPEVKKPAAPAAEVIVDTKVDKDGVDEDNKGKRGQKRKLGDLIREADSKKKYLMANAEMTRLWNLCPDNSEATRQQKRDFVPSLDQYFRKAVEQVTSGDSVPANERLVNDSDFGWRGLRILACRSPHFFTHSTAPITTVVEYLTAMIRKLAKDLPSVNGRPQNSSASQVSQKRQEQVEEKVVPDQGDEDNCGDEEMDDEEEEENSREELKPITKEEQVALAANLAKLSEDKWKALTKKLGFQDDEVQYILDQKTGDVAGCVEHFLQLWVENEGDEANKEFITYTLEGLKMPQVVEGVFK